jgi:hypothetical protein
MTKSFSCQEKCVGSFLNFVDPHVPEGRLERSKAKGERKKAKGPRVQKKPLSFNLDPFALMNCRKKISEQRRALPFRFHQTKADKRELEGYEGSFKRGSKKIKKWAKKNFPNPMARRPKDGK